MNRHKTTGHATHERWLVSYADFITLLFAFFVVLYASSQVDKRKAGKLADAIQEGFQQLGAFPAGQKKESVMDPASAKRTANEPRVIDSSRAELQRLRTELESALSNEIARREIKIFETADGLVLSLRETGFFDTGSAQVRPDATERFGRMAHVLGEQSNLHMRIEGHTDNLPIHNSRFASNWELSTARATEVVRLLAIQYGFNPANLAAAGYAEFHPAGDNATEEGRQANRRVDIVALVEPTKLGQQR